MIIMNPKALCTKYRARAATKPTWVRLAGVDVGLKEHRSDVKFHRVSNAIVLHIEKCNHFPDWDRTSLLEKNVKNRRERC